MSTSVVQDDTSITLVRETALPPAALFAVLRDPRRHAELDGSGMVRAATGTEPITAVGQIFTMDMDNRWIGAYRTDNLVVAHEPDRHLAWDTSRAGNPPAGQRWTWRLAPLAAGGTRITHVYDWSRVTDPAILARVSYPRVTADELRTTVENLLSAASVSTAGRLNPS